MFALKACISINRHQCDNIGIRDYLYVFKIFKDIVNTVIIIWIGIVGIGIVFCFKAKANTVNGFICIGAVIYLFRNKRHLTGGKGDGVLLFCGINHFIPAVNVMELHIKVLVGQLFKGFGFPNIAAVAWYNISHVVKWNCKIKIIIFIIYFYSYPFI